MNTNVEEMDTVTVNKTIEKWQLKRQFYEQNLSRNIKYPDEDFYRQLDSSLKKIPVFIKKLKTFSPENVESLIQDTQKLNLSRYISEIVSAITDLKCKPTSFTSLLVLLSAFHRLYPDFSHQLILSIENKLKLYDPKDVKKDPEFTSLKMSLKLYCDLVFNGFASNCDESFLFIINFWKRVLKNDVTDDYSHCTVFSNFIKSLSEDLLLYKPSQIEFFTTNKIDYTKNFILSYPIKNIFIDFAKEYFVSLSQYYEMKSKSFEKLEKSCKLTIGLRGELHADQKDKEKYEKALCERLQTTQLLLAETLDIPIESIEEKDVDEDIEIAELPSQNNSTAPSIPLTEQIDIWEDEDAKQFYEDLRDFSSVLQKASAKDIENLKKATKEEERKKSGYSNKNWFDLESIENMEDDLDSEMDEIKPTPKNPAMALFDTKLQSCTNRDLIDQCSEEFLLYLNTKANRKILVDILYNVNKNRFDLLPFYSRFIANTYPYAPEIGIQITQMLRREFFYHLRRKKQFNIDYKLKTVRYIGELVKFKLFIKVDAINIIKSLLLYFKSHYIDMLCHFLEVCGRFMFRSPESNPFMKKFLETIVTRAKMHVIDARHSMMIQNAIYYCNPLAYQGKKHKELPILHRYIKKLLFKDLNKNNINEIIQRFKTFPLNEEACLNFTTKCLTSPWKVKYSYISCLASLVLCFKDFMPLLVMYVIDGIIEEIRLGLETNISRYNQRRICTMRYFGELFNFKLIDASLIFKTAYHVITYGQTMEGNSKIDPVNCVIRIRLICELLNACGVYFSTEPYKKQLESFLIFFQIYVWKKKLAVHYKKNGNIFPPEIDTSLSDTFEIIKMKKKLYETPDKVYEAASRITHYCKSNLVNMFKAYSNIGFDLQKFIEISKKESIPEPVIPQITHDVINEDKTQESEDADFDKAFEKTILDSYNEKGIINKQASIDFTIPSYLKEKYEYFQETFERDLNDTRANKMNILLMTKKNNKLHFNDVSIPKDDYVAINLITRYNNRKEEQQEVKRLILNMNRKQIDPDNSKIDEIKPAKPQNLPPTVITMDRGTKVQVKTIQTNKKRYN